MSPSVNSLTIATGTVFTPYPFQVNTAGLPLDVRLECLLGFIETLRHPERRTSRVPPAQSLISGLPFLKAVPEAAADEPSFLDWIHTQFGPGFARHFFEPYNRKLWQRDLSDSTVARTFGTAFARRGLIAAAIRAADLGASVVLVNWHLKSDELARRKAAWKPRRTIYTSGVLAKYAVGVGSARGGAVTHPGGKAEGHVYADI